eukprot:scaffold66355_cov62-Phaeocystis_antarctica.AAC.1
MITIDRLTIDRRPTQKSAVLAAKFGSTVRTSPLKRDVRTVRPVANMVKQGSRTMCQTKQRRAPADKVTGAIAKTKVRPRSEVRKEGADKGDVKTRAKKSIAQMGPNHTTHSKFNTLHLKKRRSTRPIKAKESRSARLKTEDAAAETETQRQSCADLTQKRRLLTKLHSRQMAAGKTEAAAQTQEQINSIGM